MPLAAKITIGADNDPAGEQAAIAAATKWREEGRDVRIIKPRELKDWNDVLQANHRPTIKTTDVATTEL